MTTLYDRIHKTEGDRRETDLVPVHERRQPTEPFVAPWRKRSIEQAGDRYVAVTDTTERAA